MGKASRLKQLRHLEHQGVGQMLQRLRHAQDHTNLHVQLPPAGQRRLADLVLDFATPFLRDLHCDEDRCATIRLAIAAWNLSFLPASDQAQAIQEHFLPAFGPAACQRLQGMIERKQTHFPHATACILDHDLQVVQGQIRLSLVADNATADP